SSKLSIKDMRDADVIFVIRIKHESNVSTPLDTCEKLMPNKGPAVSQLEYSRMIGCLMYAMTCTRPDIAFLIGKLSSGKNKYHQTVDCYDIYSQSDYSSDGCEDNFREWRTGRGGLYEPTSTLYRAWQ
nr:zinc finger, CCHC-type [Tanacetum cinerariifolium]